MTFQDIKNTVKHSLHTSLDNCTDAEERAHIAFAINLISVYEEGDLLRRSMNDECEEGTAGLSRTLRDHIRKVQSL